ncbi:MAG: hypothetical protein HPY66_0571 [Firmicutes bacterium]|nr:hypothetical protein [Bacillota bacterium]
MTDYIFGTTYQIFGTVLPTHPTRCVIIVDKDLPIGRLVNAAAVTALTIGQRHPGLIPIGIAVLAASQDELPDIRRKGLEAGCDVIDFPVEGQQTTNYQAFREAVAAIQPEEMRYAGIALVGEKKEISKIVGNLRLLK